MRQFNNSLFKLLTAACALLACALLLAILAAIAVRGFPAVSFQFFTEQIRLAGAAGGIFYNLIGTGILIAAALVVAAPVATALALLHEVYWRGHPGRQHLTMLLYAMNGIPSILFGLFGLIVFVKFFGLGKSWLSGGVLLGLLIVPTLAIALIERIASLPSKYIEAAAGLGLRQEQIIWSVILPQSVGGLVTGALLGLARAAGETAPIMFTATIFAGATIPSAIKESPVLSLPYHIFVLAQDSLDPAAGGKLWGTALTLLALVTFLSLLSLPLRLKAHEEARHA